MVHLLSYLAYLGSTFPLTVRERRGGFWCAPGAPVENQRCHRGPRSICAQKGKAGLGHPQKEDEGSEHHIIVNPTQPRPARFGNRALAAPKEQETSS